MAHEPRGAGVVYKKADSGVKKSPEDKKREAFDLEVVGQMAEPEFSGTFGEYNDKVIQFGYVCLFSGAFPIAPFIYVVYNLIELRTEGRRPAFVPRGETRPAPGSGSHATTHRDATINGDHTCDDAGGNGDGACGWIQPQYTMLFDVMDTGKLVSG